MACSAISRIANFISPVQSKRRVSVTCDDIANSLRASIASGRHCKLTDVLLICSSSDARQPGIMLNNHSPAPDGMRGVQLRRRDSCGGCQTLLPRTQRVTHAPGFRQISRNHRRDISLILSRALANRHRHQPRGIGAANASRRHWLGLNPPAIMFTRQQDVTSVLLASFSQHFFKETLAHALNVDGKDKIADQALSRTWT